MRTYDKDDFISENHYLWKKHPPPFNWLWSGLNIYVQTNFEGPSSKSFKNFDLSGPGTQNGGPKQKIVNRYVNWAPTSMY